MTTTKLLAAIVDEYPNAWIFSSWLTRMYSVYPGDGGKALGVSLFRCAAIEDAYRVVMQRKSERETAI